MKKSMISKVTASVLLAGVFVLSGCSDKSSPPPQQEEPNTPAATFDVSGSASYVGKIFRGDVKAYDASGKELGNTMLNADGTYSLNELSTEPSYVVLQSGAKGVGNDNQANNDDDNLITLNLSSDVVGETADLSLSNYLNKEYGLSVPSPLSLAQKNYLLSMQEALTYFGIEYKEAFEYAGGALTQPLSESAYSVLSTGTSTALLKQNQALMDKLSPEQEEMLESISDMLMNLTADYTGTPNQKKIAYNTIVVIMSAIKELAADGLKNDDLASLIAVTKQSSRLAVKSWVTTNIDNNTNFYAQGVKMAKTAQINPDATPISNSDVPTTITTCSSLNMSGPAAVVCGPQADNFKFAADFGELGPIDNDPNTPDGGMLLYQASSDLNDVTPEFAQSGKGENRIEHTWVEKKYIRLNTAAKSLDTDAKFDLIKDYIEPLFSIKGYVFENDNNPFNLEDGDTRTFAATMVLHFTNDQAENTPNKEFMTATIEVDVARSGEKLYFSSPANSKVLLTAKKLEHSTGVLIVVPNQDMDDATIGNEFSFNPGKYFNRLIAAGDSIGVSTVAKDILIKNLTQEGPIKMHLTLHEKMPNGTFDRSFVRNPGTFEPAEFSLNLGGASNPYADAFDDGAVQAVKVKLILN
jgi:hypothetical protein